MGSSASTACDSWTAPFATLPPFGCAAFCVGKAGCMGALPDNKDAGCTEPLARAVVTPEVDSDFETGQNPPLAFFLAGAAFSPFDIDGASVVVTVELEDAVDASDDEEVLRVTPFLWGMNILETSSVLMAENPPLVFPPFHPSLGRA
jgi:hypothetical protein